MENLAQTKVSKIVAQNYKTARVFTRYGIDFCCNGGIPLEEACENKQVDLREIENDISEVLSTPIENDYQKMDPTELVDHIVNIHHDYVSSTIPVLQAYLNKLCQVHGERHPELFKVNELFDEAAIALLSHMEKEEFVLFPFIKSLVEASENQYPLSEPYFGHIENPIAMMEHEHAEEGERFRKIARITNQYQPPSDACQTYRVAFALLSEFEEDLHLHIHLENNILFPKSIELFKEYFEQSGAVV
ncbi:iron-sulfur cluster repair di-iron protein [Ekhidna sp.]|uniref:iron-sulfur cluster repair di-iron protein n=1 Tax=Ekhidna sp. TaxID=2608089 RepID=UPI003B59D651